MSVRIKLSDLKSRPRAYEGEEASSLLELTDSDPVTAAGPIRYRLDAFVVPGMLCVRGDLSVEVDCPCSRCAVSFRLVVREKAYECFHPVRADSSGDLKLDASPADGEPVAEGRDARRDAVRAGHEDSDAVDLTGDIREAMILALPSHPVCSPECKGLCSRCGADLNRQPCSCRPERDSRWSLLDQLPVE